METYKAIFKDHLGENALNGANGVAFKAKGHYDESSAEFGAWLFAPNPNDEAHEGEGPFYCGEKDLTFIQK